MKNHCWDSKNNKIIYQNADNKAGKGSFESVIKRKGCAVWWRQLTTHK